MTHPTLTTSDELLRQAEQAAKSLEWSRAADLLTDAGTTAFILDKRAFYLSRAKRYAEALAIYEELRKRAPGESLYYYMTGYQYYAQEQYQPSIGWFEKAVELNPKNIKCWWRLAHALEKTGRQADAEKAAASVLRLWLELPDADKELDRVKYARACFLLGRAYLPTDPQSALPLLLKAVENGAKDDPYTHYRVAQALRRTGDVEMALEHLREASRLKPGDVSIELELALVLAQLKSERQAIFAIQRVERRCRGWMALKAGKIALSAGDSALADRLLQTAARDRDTRGKPQMLDALKALSVARPESSRRDVVSDNAAAGELGEVDVIRPERGFGFLVDRRDGTRRHFRLPRNLAIKRGDQVVFDAYEAEKGPAARNLRPA